MDLDTKRHYGETFGIGMTHKYEQDGKLFDAQGMWIHPNGARVTPQEKVEDANKVLDLHMKKKKREIASLVREYEKEGDTLKAEADDILIDEAAKNLDRLEDPSMHAYKSTESVKAALDLVEYPYEDDSKFAKLQAILRRIFEAA